MKKLFVGFMALLYTGVFANAVPAQQINPSPIRKILLTTGWGGMANSETIGMEVVNEDGQWNSYQVLKDVFNSDAGGEPSVHTTARKQITTLTQQQVMDFLNSIAVIKPHYNLKTFNLLPAKLIAGLRKNTKGTVEKPKLETYINETSLYQALANIIKDETVLDAAINCSISIVKGNGDTLKMESSHMYATMLPWRINGRNSYDMNINRFLIAAMGNMDYPNKYILSNDALKETIYKSIDTKYPSEPIAAYRWDNSYPDNVALLKKTFTGIGKYYRGRDTYNCLLQSNGMPSNVKIETAVNISDRKGIKRLTDFNNLVTACLRTDNFVFKYFRNNPNAVIYLQYPTRPGNIFNELGNKMAFLKNIDTSQVVRFNVSVPDDSSTWLLLPDRKLVLTYHLNSTSDGTVAPIFPTDDTLARNRFMNAYKITVFNEDGSVLK